MEWDKKQQKEIEKARGVLGDGEKVLDVTSGLGVVRRMGKETRRNGSLIVTDRRVIFFTKKIGGYEMSDHVYGLLTSVDYKKGVAFGNINLSASGDHYHISLIPKNAVERVARTIRSQMGEVRAHPSTSRSGDIPAQIKQLAALHKQGILNDSEFLAKKTDLLSKM